MFATCECVFNSQACTTKPKSIGVNGSRDNINLLSCATCPFTHAPSTTLFCIICVETVLQYSTSWLILTLSSNYGTHLNHQPWNQSKNVFRKHWNVKFGPHEYSFTKHTQPPTRRSLRRSLYETSVPVTVSLSLNYTNIWIRTSHYRSIKQY